MAHVLEDEWKLERTDSFAQRFGFHIDWNRSVWPGVVCKDHPEIVQHAVNSGYISDPGGHNLGNVGAALAHITLWEHIVQQMGPADIVLVLEDNVIFKPESLTGTCAAIAAAGDTDYFDYLALAVREPRGAPFDEHIGIRRVIKEPSTQPVPPNLWMSSYLVSGAGAAKLLDCMKASRPDVATDIIDQVVSRQCLSGDPSIRAFIVDHKRFFDNRQTRGDSRKKLNMDTALHPKR